MTNSMNVYKYNVKWKFVQLGIQLYKRPKIEVQVKKLLTIKVNYVI